MDAVVLLSQPVSSFLSQNLSDFPEENFLSSDARHGGGGAVGSRAERGNMGPGGRSWCPRQVRVR